MKNKILERRAALEAALFTVNYQIKELKPYYSREQVRCWYIHRKAIKEKLKGLPTAEQVKQDAREHTALIKSIRERKPLRK